MNLALTRDEMVLLNQGLTSSMDETAREITHTNSMEPGAVRRILSLSSKLQKFSDLKIKIEEIIRTKYKEKEFDIVEKEAEE